MSSLGQYLGSSTYVLALLGAGLSAPSGIPTFETFPIWQGHSYQWLATEPSFGQNPVLVWQFYESMRELALNAQPNSAHKALAELAAAKSHFLAITQNIDGMFIRFSLIIALVF